MKRSAPIFAALAIVAGAGLLHAVWTERWGAAPARIAAVKALESVPMTLGTWDGRPLTMSDREMEIAEADGYVSREYVERASGSAVSLLLVCGRPGPISVHPPEACYQGAGYVPAGAIVPVSVKADSGAAEFRAIDFRKPESAAAQLRVFYTWGHKGQWKAPDKPRLTYALSFDRDPVLFKMYVVRSKAGDTMPVDKDPAVDFLRALLPVLQRSLFEGAS